MEYRIYEGAKHLKDWNGNSPNIGEYIALTDVDIRKVISIIHYENNVTIIQILPVTPKFYDSNIDYHSL